jgi:hypothetical protein
MKRILVIGTSGSGKTSFAMVVSEAFHLPFHASDPFYWGAHWSKVPEAVVHEKVKAVVVQHEWVLDGNFDDYREWVWEPADCILWLDYAFPLILLRVLTRNLRWWITRQPVWSGNRMTLSQVISGVQHSIRSYFIKKEKYDRWSSEYPKEKFIRFRNPRESRLWLQEACTGNRISNHH